MTGHTNQGRFPRDGRRAAKFILTEAVLFLAVITLQSSVFARLTIFGGVPDLCYLTLLLIAYFCGKETGAVTGIAAGFAVEALCSQGISLLPVVYLFCGYLCGYFTRAITQKQLVPFFTVAAVALPVRLAVTLVYICLTYDQIHLLNILLKTLLPQFFATAVFVPILFFPVRWVCGWMKKA